jgi:ClpX C4-type zinc finger protein
LPLVLALVLAAAVIAIAVWLLLPTRSKPDEDDDRERRALEHEAAASRNFQAALAACYGLPARLDQIADAAHAKAAALREAHEAGLVSTPHRVDPEWRPPWELRRDSPRLPVIAWQRLDRAFDQLTAQLDEPHADLRRRSDAYEQVAKAARDVAKQLVDDDGPREFSSALARCGFCGKPASEVQKIIAGPTSAICDECVALCVKLIDEEHGEGGAPPSDRT